MHNEKQGGTTCFLTALTTTGEDLTAGEQGVGRDLFSTKSLNTVIPADLCPFFFHSLG